MQATFFVVMSQNRGLSDQPYKHESTESATEEAKRLAGQAHGDRFFVLQAIRMVEHVSVVTTDLVPDIPF